MKTYLLALPCLVAATLSAGFAQGTPATGNDAPAKAVLAALPWNYGVFFGGGFGVGDRSGFTFTNAGFHLGKVLTDQHLPGFARGQFEYSGDILPYWQSQTPAPHAQVFSGPNGTTPGFSVPYGGGTFTGLSMTPIQLRWDLAPTRRIAPYLQGAGGLIWTNHKYPPDILVTHGQPGGTSVWNFTPQAGVGLHYFLKNRQTLDLQASAVHISSASLGDRNPGVNASVQFQIGYSWWR